MPQCTKVQQSLMELFLLARPTIQSLQSTISQFQVKWFLQNVNQSVFEPKDSLRICRLPMKKSEPPVPLRSSLLKLMAIESTQERVLSLGRYCSQIQVEPRKVASKLTHMPCSLQNLTISQLTSMAPLKVLPQLPPNQNGISPSFQSSSTISFSLAKSSPQLRFSATQMQGTALLQQISFTARPRCELMWLPPPQYPTNRRTVGLLPSIPSSFIFLNFAACTETNIDSVAELLIMPPPLLLSKNVQGRASIFALQSIMVFYSSVKEGATAQLKLGV